MLYIICTSYLSHLVLNAQLKQHYILFKISSWSVPDPLARFPGFPDSKIMKRFIKCVKMTAELWPLLERGHTIPRKKTSFESRLVNM